MREIDRLDLRTRATATVYSCAEWGPPPPCPPTAERVAVDSSGHVAWQARRPEPFIWPNALHPEYFTAETEQIHAFDGGHDVLVESGRYNAFTGIFKFAKTRTLQWQNQGVMHTYTFAGG